MQHAPVLADPGAVVARPAEGQPAAAPAVSAPVLVAQVRSIAVDLLQATGMTRSEALRALRGQLTDPHGD